MSLGTLAFLCLAAFGAGFVNAIAGGGGLVSLPALLGTGLPPHLALGTNKGQAVFGEASAAWTYWRRGQMDRSRIPVGFAAGFVGSVAGAALQLMVPPGPLEPICLVLLIAAAGVTFLPKSLAPRRRTAPTGVFLAGFAFLIGAYDGFFGPGTGTLLLVGFVWFFGDDPLSASANAKVVNLASNLAAFLSFAVKGTILFRLALPMAAANMAGSVLGARLAHRLGARFVRGVTVVVVLALIVRAAFKLLG